MKRIIILLICMISFISCTNKSMDGIYSYKESKSEDPILGFGKGIGCSMVGKIELKDGYCYLNFLGTENRVKFNIEEDKIILNAVNGNEIVLKILDSNTINFNGCNFVKLLENNQKEKNQNIDSTNGKKLQYRINNHSKIKNELKSQSFNEIQTFTNSSKIFDSFDGCGYFFAKSKEDLDQNEFIFAGYLYGHHDKNQEEYIQLVLENKIEKLIVTSCEKDKRYSFENKSYKGTLILPSVYENETRTQIFKSAELKIENKITGKIYFCELYGESVC